MDDLISRQAAIDEVINIWADKPFGNPALVEIKDCIEALPPADARENVYGEWIKMTVSSGRKSWKCSVCGRRARGELKNLPFCHCGAMMRGENNGMD